MYPYVVFLDLNVRTLNVSEFIKEKLFNNSNSLEVKAWQVDTWKIGEISTLS